MARSIFFSLNELAPRGPPPPSDKGYSYSTCYLCVHGQCTHFHTSPYLHISTSPLHHCIRLPRVHGSTHIELIHNFQVFQRDHPTSHQPHLHHRSLRRLDSQLPHLVSVLLDARAASLPTAQKTNDHCPPPLSNSSVLTPST